MSSTLLALLAVTAAAMPWPDNACAEEPSAAPSLADVRAAVENREARCRPLALRYSVRSWTDGRPTPGRDIRDATLVASLDGALPTVLRFTGPRPPGRPEELFAPPQGPPMDTLEVVVDRTLTVLRRPASSTDVPWKGARSRGRQLFTPSPLGMGLCVLGAAGQPLSAYLTSSRARVVGLEHIEPFGACVIVETDWSQLGTEPLPAVGSEEARPARLWLSMAHGAYPVRGRLYAGDASDVMAQEPTLRVKERSYQLMHSWEVTTLSSGDGPAVPLAARSEASSSSGASGFQLTVEPGSIATGEAALRIAEELLHDATPAEVREAPTQRRISWSPPPLPAPGSLPPPPGSGPAAPGSPLKVTPLPTIPVSFVAIAVVLAVLLVLGLALARTRRG
ncbi:MAG: hypothetical protein AB7T63_17995 [Planctomycetota bacterium]